MSLEAKIDALTAAVTALTAVLAGRAAPTVAAAPAPVAVVPAPAPAPVAPPVVAMPAPPTFVTQPLVTAPAAAPFSDAKGLMDYVMSAYKALGPQKGASIQQVLTGLGVSTINEVKPEQYGALFAGVEALK